MLTCAHCDAAVNYDTAKMCPKCYGALCIQECPPREADVFGRSTCKEFILSANTDPKIIEMLDRMKKLKS